MTFHSLDDLWRASRQIRKAGPWIGLSLGLAVCALVIISAQQVEGDPPPVGTRQWWLIQAGSVAQLIFIGFAAALFTRFFGSVGMYRDAIADLLREDRWLDRRNDLEELWRDVTRRVFMPGFRGDADEHKDLLPTVNRAMTSMLSDEKTPKPYFHKDVVYIYSIEWHNREDGLVRSKIKTLFDLHPYHPEHNCVYTLKFSTTSGAAFNPGDVYLHRLKVNDIEIVVDSTEKFSEPDRQQYYTSERIGADAIEYNVRLGHKLRPINGKYAIERETITIQKIDEDPVFIQEMAQVVSDIDITIWFSSADGIRAYLEEIGMEGTLKKHETDTPDRGMLRRVSVRALLPRQGFAIVMVRSRTTQPPAPQDPLLGAQQVTMATASRDG